MRYNSKLYNIKIPCFNEKNWHTKQKNGLDGKEG